MTTGFLEVGQGQGQGIRCVGVRDRWQIQHPLDHFCDGGFLSSAESDDRLFHFAGSQFKDWHTGFRDRREGGTSGLAHNEGRLDILGKKETFDRAHPGTMLTGDISQRLQDVEQAAGSFPSGGAPNGAEGEGLMLRAPVADDSPACAAEGRVDSENHASKGRGRFTDSIGFHPVFSAACQAMLNCRELFWGNGHFYKTCPGFCPRSNFRYVARARRGQEFR